jgi:hypothetical protein
MRPDSVSAPVTTEFGARRRSFRIGTNIARLRLAGPLSLVLAAAALTACAAHRDPAFGFRIETCHGEGVDTFAGTVTRDMIGVPDTTVDLHLTASELDRIRQEVAKIRFFELPDTLIGASPSADCNSSPRPMEVEVRMGGKLKVVTVRALEPRDARQRGVPYRMWTDKGTPAEGQRKRLMALFREIMAVVWARAEYKALPDPKGAYL